MTRLGSGFLASLLSLALSAAAAHATVPVPPDQVAYSGYAADTPTGAQLVARIYDAASGGTLIYRQIFTGVPVTDGHFTVMLGPTGASLGPPPPLTTSLRTALTGDLAAGPDRFLEISVNAVPQPRVQLVLVPYAMRSDHALTSDVATNALDAQALGGVEPVVLEALFEKWNFDGGPPSDDPSEGTADTDGDGDVNFVDADNDADGLTDSDEVSVGTDINLITPTLGTVTPNFGSGSGTTPISVTGTGFLSGLTAQLGSQNLVITNLTGTSFQADAGPNNGPFPNAVALTVTNTNGELATKTSAFTFTEPGSVPGAVPLTFTLAGPTLPVGIVTQANELLVYGSQTSQNRYALDTVIDGNLAFNVTTNFNHRIPSVLSWSATRVLHGLRSHAATNQMQLVRDANADNFLANSEAIVIETPGVVSFTRSPGLVFDASGRPGGGYLRLVGSTSTAMAFHDRDGNGSFGGLNEVVTIEPVGGSTDALGDAVFDPSGRLAYVYYDSGNALVRVAHDRSGDGDFDDSPGGAPELATAVSIGTPACLDASFDGSGRLGVVYTLGGSTTLLWDRNGDADFADAGESIALPGSGASGCDVATSPVSGRQVIVHNPGNELRLLVDLNDDGDFVDPIEDTLLLAPITAPLGVATTSSGAVRVVAPQGVVQGPVR